MRRGDRSRTDHPTGDAPEVVQVSPLMFGDDGYWGGGERYALELARAQAELASTRFVTFGTRPRRERVGQLELVVLPRRRRFRRNDLNPVSTALLRELDGVRVVHVHQYHTALTDLVLLIGAMTRQPVFVTDHGGWAPNLGPLLPRDRMIAGLLAVSNYAASFFPQLSSRTTVIYGGADTRRFCPAQTERRAIVFVGRLMPHKGIDVLIKAAEPEMEVEIYGRPYNLAYREVLSRLAAGKRVRFVEDADDEQIVRAFQSARAVVLPSVQRSRYGSSSAKAELLGLVLLEAMSCGTPVVCSDIGPLPEIVLNGQTGYVSPAGDPLALRERLRELLLDDERWTRMSRAALVRARSQFSWTAVAKHTFEAYLRHRAG